MIVAAQKAVTGAAYLAGLYAPMVLHMIPLMHFVLALYSGRCAENALTGIALRGAASTMHLLYIYPQHCTTQKSCPKLQMVLLLTSFTYQLSAGPRQVQIFKRC